ncbi:hypothetical protein [Algoriphagus persicinus]|uniref:hypothetical protein n=1 Tax=Algoriphagus persicinus TaxID=3108754 RepID=UPI002B3E4C85|nr:hypothetical protein [Algoriphagus sp. E1-3-M2]MEB2785349.1 hypothetical protein [Algoriphagus sp. E1-3-M2]
MKPRLYLFLFIFFSSNFVFSQTDGDSIFNLSLNKIALVNQGDSYVTFPPDIGNLEPLIFEANISPGFIIRERKDSRVMAILTPQIIIRMYDEFSYPVRTPSYMPNISFYFLTESKRSVNKLSLFGKIAHHSNGQDGDFYDENGNINLKSGNFTTNFIELGLIKSFYNQRHNYFRFFKSSVEIHPKTWMLGDMHGKYSGLRWHNTFLVYKLPLNGPSTGNNKANFSFKVETSWMVDNVNDWKTFDLNRLNASLRFYYHPKILEDIGLFVQLYHGMDYYNIYLQHQISVIRIGIMTEILKF